VRFLAKSRGGEQKNTRQKYRKLDLSHSYIYTTV
jgi:hypothetical protein